MAKRVLVADDEKNMRWILEKNLKEWGFEVILAQNGEEALNLFLEEEPDLAILDLRMPALDGMSVLEKIRSINDKFPAVIVTAHGDVDSAVRAVRLGAVDYIAKPFTMEELRITLLRALNVGELNKEIEFLRHEAAGPAVLIGQSRKMSSIFQLIEQVADTSATILITGESGTGKELIASAIHNRSSRCRKPYIKVNCGAIPENLMESELFGHEKGAFTGALNRKLGRFDRAQGGTIFLDEMGELSPNLQVKLLRVLQEREFERVGGVETIKADVRVIAATNRDLEVMVNEGRFREDLLYRLKVIQIHVPPLRERVEDILPLVEHFIQKYSSELNRDKLRIDNNVIDVLKKYNFPGNIRELENIIERAVILSAKGTLSLNSLPREVLKKSLGPRREIVTLPEDGVSLEEVEESLVRQALDKADGNQTQAARLLGITRYALKYRMEKYNIDLKICFNKPE
ncbi:MAG: sigma-54-dependent Fis family transcriptional regulator [Firmicutes bacterium]|nr:sigma-54-dependent Fis family transcriptional regulator [Bacillota bacterium]